VILALGFGECEEGVDHPEHVVPALVDVAVGLDVVVGVVSGEEHVRGLEACDKAAQFEDRALCGLLGELS